VRVSAAAFGVAALGAIVVFASQEGLDGLDKLASVIGAVAGVASLWVAVRPPRWLRDQDDRAGGTAADPLDRLAAAVTELWEPEERRRRLRHPDALPIAWTTESPPVADHWANVRRDQQDEPLDLGGSVLDPDVDRLADLVANPALRGRVIILGEPGSGKTSLLLRMVLTSVARRAPGARVPVLVRLSTWNPSKQSLEDWIRDRLELDYGQRTTVALSQLLPVLDGLDEMTEPFRAAALRAISASFAADSPLVLTSRIEQFLGTLEALGEGVVAGAAVIRLTALPTGAVTDYLDRAVPPARSARWEAMWARDRDECGGRVVAALDTPLWVSLLRGAYAEHADEDVEELIGLADDPDELRGHLLDRVLVTAYPEPPQAGQRWTRVQAGEALAFLARDLQARDTYDIAWWEIRRRMSAWFVVALAVGAAAALVAQRLVGPTGIVAALVSITAFFASRPARGRIELPRSQLSVRGVLGVLADTVGYALLITGAIFGVTAWRGGYSVWDIPLRSWLTSIPINALLLLTPLAVVRFTTLFERDADVLTATDPSVVLRDDRRHAVAVGALIAIVFALLPVVAKQTAQAAISATEFVGGAIYGLLLAIGTAFLSHAWGRFLVVRAGCAIRGQLPLHLMAFLEDTLSRDVLRTAGGVYQFRHALLRDRLANRPPISPDEPQPDS
jgi:NACHT domain